MTIQCFAAFSANFSEIFPPAAKKAIFTLENQNFLNQKPRVLYPKN